MSHEHKGKLRIRIFLVILGGLIPAIVIAVLGVYAVKESHREDVARLESAVLAEKAEEIAGYVNGMNLLGQTRIVAPYLNNLTLSTSAEKFAITNTLGVVASLDAESFVDLSGKETVHVDRAHPDGYAAADLQDVSATPEFRAARAGAYYVSPVSYAPRGPFITFASPVKNDTGDIIAVVMGKAYLDQLENIVASGTIGTTGYLYLVDTNGAIAAGGGPLTARAGGIDVASESIVRDVLNGRDRLAAADLETYPNIAGANVIAAAKSIPQFGWGLIAEWPTSEADSLVNSLFARDALLFAAVLLVVFAASLILAAYIVRPIKKLQEGTARVAQGKFNEGVLIATGDELEDLGESFNNMVQGLKQLEALKDEFVFIAAHELKTPVAAMKGYLSLILDGTTGAIPDATKQYIEKVIASDNRLVQLVNDLLEVARSQAGRLTIKVTPTDLAPPISSVLDELKSLADEKSVKTIYEPPAGLPKALADADRIKEVMVNLVGNAIKYMGGSGTITITHEIKEGKIITRVADTGLGMSKEAQAKLFQKFYRVQTEKTRDITGTGLGLFIVKQIIEKMGGEIWVESEEGKGSAFSFSLPEA